MKEIKLYKSHRKFILLIFGSSIFVLLGIWGNNQGDMPAWISWWLIIFFGFSIIVGFINILDRRPQIIINEFGIFDRTTHKDFINWEIIQNAYPIDIGGQKFICLVVDEQFKPSRKKNVRKSNFIKYLNEEIIGAQELNIYLGSVEKIDVFRLTEFILLMRTAIKSDKNEIITKALSEWKKF